MLWHNPLIVIIFPFILLVKDNPIFQLGTQTPFLSSLEARHVIQFQAMGYELPFKKKRLPVLSLTLPVGLGGGQELPGRATPCGRTGPQGRRFLKSKFD